MLRILCCLALVVYPVLTWSASAIIYGVAQTGQPVGLAYSPRLPGSLTGLSIA
jgi:hypothetical protein